LLLHLLFLLLLLLLLLLPVVVNSGSRSLGHLVDGNNIRAHKYARVPDPDAGTEGRTWAQLSVHNALHHVDGCAKGGWGIDVLLVRST
jgi:hypothetical protein